MGVVIPPGFGSAAIILTSSSGTAPFVTTIGVDLTEFGGDFVGAANEIFASYLDSFQGLTSENLQIERCTLSVGSDGAGGSVDSTLPGEPGLASGASDAVAMAAVVVKSTNVLGRSGRGRAYLCGVLRETDVGFGGTIDSGPRNAIRGAYQAWLADMEDGTSGSGPIAPFLLHSPEVEMVPSRITGVSVRAKVGWVRGRLH